MPNVYVVIQVGYEYNDEINHRPQTGGGDPIRVFANKQLADLYCKVKSIKELRESNLRQYYYSLEDIDSTGQLEAILKKHKLILNDDEDDYENFDEDAIGKLNDDALGEILDNINLSFFEVVEVSDEIPVELIKLEIQSRTGEKEVKI